MSSPNDDKESPGGKENKSGKSKPPSDVDEEEWNLMSIDSKVGSEIFHAPGEEFKMLEDGTKANTNEKKQKPKDKSAQTKDSKSGDSKAKDHKSVPHVAKPKSSNTSQIPSKGDSNTKVNKSKHPKKTDSKSSVSVSKSNSTEKSIDNGDQKKKSKKKPSTSDVSKGKVESPDSSKKKTSRVSDKSSVASSTSSTLTPTGSNLSGNHGKYLVANPYGHQSSSLFSDIDHSASNHSDLVRIGNDNDKQGTHQGKGQNGGNESGKPF